MSKRISTAEAALRLGVKTETLYAYVSRGLLQSELDPSGKGSTFAIDDVDRMARRARRGRAAGPLDLAISSHITRLDEKGPAYRGRVASDLARTHTFEQVAEWIWTGQPEALDGPSPRWAGNTAAIAAMRKVSKALTQASPVERLTALTMTAAGHDPFRSDLSPDNVRSISRSLIASLVDSLRPNDQPMTASPIAERLARVVASPHPRPAVPLRRLVGIIDALLVLLADHELAISTFAVRVAASGRADPYALVATGLGPMAGPLHGTAARHSTALLAQASELGAERAIAAAFSRTNRIGGFGHRVYRVADPRAVVVLDMVRTLGARRRVALVDEVARVVTERSGAHPNIDYATASLAFVADLDPQTPELVFGIARIAGWIAHGLEEYDEAPLRFRVRARYVE